MEEYITTVYVITDEVLRILNAKETPQCKMSNTEVITFAIVAAKFFEGQQKKARYFCKRLGFFPDILSQSRLNRRIRAISWACWQAIFRFLSFCFLQEKKEFAVDSFLPEEPYRSTKIISGS